MLGRKNMHAGECHQNGFIGADYGLHVDLTHKLPADWREFNKSFIPVYLANRPEKSKIAAGLACGAIYTISKAIKKGDVVLSLNGNDSYMIGEVVSDYVYSPDGILPHRRKVQWYPKTVARSDMNDRLQRSTGPIGTVSNITKHSEEIELLLEGNTLTKTVSVDKTIEDPTVFALEKHLEDFLVHNWSNTILGRKYDIFEDDGELSGQQYLGDTGPIDILAISKDKKEILVVELKKGRASDVVVGQIQRYMGYVMEELAENGQTVSGVIIALEEDLRLQRALNVTPNIEFYRYQVSFQLFKN
jgi:restriction system protein